LTVDVGTVGPVVATMFFVIVVGYIARKLKLVDEASSKLMSDLIIRVGQPFMIISAVLGMPYSASNLREGGLILLVALIVHAVAAVLALVATFRVKDTAERRLTEFAAMFANCGFMGFPLLRAVFGDVGLFWASFFVIVFNLVCWTYGQYILSRADSRVKIKPLNIFVNYGTVPCVLGLLLYVLRVGDTLSPKVFEAMDYLGSICTPLSMLVVGGLLATVPIKRLFTEPKIYLLSFVKLVALPFVCGALLAAVGFSKEMAMFGAIMAALPTAANTAIFAESYNIKPSYAAHTVGVTTLFSVITIPASLYFVSRLLDFLYI
jgi:predicted permease